MTNFKRIFSSFLIASLLSQYPMIATKAESMTLSQDLDELKKSLLEAGFEVRLDRPPMQGAYGLVNIKKKVIWIAPITKEMGIFRTTFLHEAVHAAQTCMTGELRPIGWILDVDEAVRLAIESILYRNYASEKFDIEREAFLMQGQSDAVQMIKKELREHC